MNISRSVPRKNPSTVYQHSTLVTIRLSSTSTGGRATPARRTTPRPGCGTADWRTRRARPTGTGRPAAGRTRRAGTGTARRRSHRRTTGIARSTVAARVSWTKTSVNQKCHRPPSCAGGADVVVDEQQRRPAVAARRAACRLPVQSTAGVATRAAVRRPARTRSRIDSIGSWNRGQVVAGDGEQQVAATREPHQVHVGRHDGADADRPQQHGGVAPGERRRRGVIASSSATGIRCQSGGSVPEHALELQRALDVAERVAAERHERARRARRRRAEHRAGTRRPRWRRPARATSSAPVAPARPRIAA